MPTPTPTSRSAAVPVDGGRPGTSQLSLLTSPLDAVAAGPIVKWAGGKRRLLPTLRRLAPPRFRRYFEPFFGGGALFFALRPRRAVLGDKNAALINAYQVVVRNRDALIGELRTHERAHCRAHYVAVRAQFNRGALDEVGAAAAFLYMNRTCFNGLWRVNRRGAFNVPWGAYASPRIVREPELHAAGALLARASIGAADFRETLETAGAGDFVYLDPPYLPRTATAGFDAYTADGFPLEEHEKLARLARQLAERGAHVLVSNHDLPAVRALFPGSVLHRASPHCSIAARRDGRKPRSELVVEVRP